ncbi:hypothetical protein LIER_24870 [Lithospermum erythrorhizon]|uniref:Reverse transcriptase RNase H-like domain-containing protein n=1 Tax=Lithospermum erythrorhizon TaxID=34254 RepID=A0AAV3R469_LITER
MFSQMGTDPNSDKISAVQGMQSPQTYWYGLLQEMSYSSIWLFLSRRSSVLIREEEKVQIQVYYVSRVMRWAETQYPVTEKLVFALIVATPRLKPYFEAHPVEVIMGQQLRKILDNPSKCGQLVEGAIKAE